MNEDWKLGRGLVALAGLVVAVLVVCLAATLSLWALGVGR